MAAPAAQANPGGCPTLNVIAVPGTWETSNTPDPGRGNGMLAQVTSGLPPGARVDYVQYPATAFPWEGDVYAASRTRAVDNARGLIAAAAAHCPLTDFALVGYSQGADAAGDLAAEIGTGIGVVGPHRLVAVGLLSDPRRSEADAFIGPPVPGNGAGGPRIGGFGLVSPSVRTICAVGDLYCSTPREDYVTRLAGFLAISAGSTPAELEKYRDEANLLYNDIMAGGGLPTLQLQITPEANVERENKIRRFYESQIHQDYSNYVVDNRGTTATRWLRNWLASQA
ncbi:cutinase family protein [Rhodococcus sp. CC-R104]|uniref:Cutinase family protein n=1 Tax=Rhodococcus chondri TaxID=3065941 RepID=A0ABU7JNV0_9NOCA|nr:cutinase family protein [Rhodococcus sp. CC-R104]MEE2031708.1 cutinase family protein [Rhodococcus sp. CC-R104]